VAQVIEHLHSKSETLSSMPQYHKKEQRSTNCQRILKILLKRLRKLQENTDGQLNKIFLILFISKRSSETKER
jgi:hypothetical protein